MSEGRLAPPAAHGAKRPSRGVAGIQFPRAVTQSFPVTKTFPMNISSSTATGGFRPDPSEFFKKADADGSGGISKDELATMLANRPKRPGETESTSSTESAEDIDKIFSTVDTDGDGVISEAENATHMENMEANGGPPPPPPGGGFAGSSSTLQQLLSTLEEEGTSSSDISSLLEKLAAELKAKGEQASLFSAEA